MGASTTEPQSAARNSRPVATIADVAAQAGVSVATVSRTLSANYPVAESTKSRVLDAVEKLGYVANAHARALAGATTRTVGIVIADVADPFFGYVARGVERQASSENRLCLIMATEADRDRELAIVDLMREQRADAVILVGGASDHAGYRKKMAARAKALAENGSVLVLCGRPSLGEEVPTVSVNYDNSGGAFAVTDYLISQGHRKILYLGGPANLSTTAARFEGFNRALQARGIAPDPELVHLGEFGRPFGYQRMREILASKTEFTAVFGANDLVAVGAMEAIAEAGLRVPEDISVVGYDNIPVSREVRPRLTTVNVPLEDLGREAVKAALGRFEYGSESANSTLGTHVVIRDSVRAI
ncbi:LacI family DNA-binding transcriptional regulator [Psychromicrobium lacuslunae]|uniref:LacI family transcriptional regulator n=1 Tax=Psychromicrobium lacuslunae TaxID=1618207 RepID=A0A0D4C1G3_9MICC|nr:LacI family DNA-binding transcriptional regulator [Psychromicrobium lacuslunae]AJT42240.1 LacI family transcriptional regulator [Psychromicrobium lacuslunae]